MALINEQTVNAGLFKVDSSILALGVIEVVELCPLILLRVFHKLLDRDCSPLEACTSSIPRSISKTVFPTAFSGVPRSSGFFKLTVSDVWLHRSRPWQMRPQNFFAVARFKSLLGRNKGYWRSDRAADIRKPTDRQDDWELQTLISGKVRAACLHCAAATISKVFACAYLCGQGAYCRRKGYEQ